MVDIFDEVEEDLRADRAQAFLRRYGIVFIAVAVLVVAGAALRVIVVMTALVGTVIVAVEAAVISTKLYRRRPV